MLKLIFALCCVGLQVICGPAHAAYVVMYGGLFESVAPITYSRSGDGESMFGFTQALPSQTIGFTLPPFNSALGRLDSAHILLTTFSSGSITTTVHGSTPTSELHARGYINFDVTLTILNNGVPIGIGSAGRFELTRCEGFGFSVACTQSISSGNAYSSLLLPMLSPEEIGVLQVLIEPVGTLRVGGYESVFEPTDDFSGGSSEATATLNIRFSPQESPTQVDYYYTPLSEVPLPASAWLILSAIGCLGLFRVYCWKST